MAEARTINVPGNGQASEQYELAPGLLQYVQAIYVEIDNTAGAAARPTLTLSEQSGVVIAKKRQGDSIPAAGTGSASWFLRGADEGGGGIQFDKDNIGGYLEIDANDQHASVIDGSLAAWNIAMRGLTIGIGAVGTFAALVLASDNLFTIHGGIVYLTGDTDANLSAEANMNITGDYVAITAASSGVDIEADGGADVNIKAADGEVFILSRAGATYPQVFVDADAQFSTLFLGADDSAAVTANLQLDSSTPAIRGNVTDGAGGGDYVFTAGQDFDVEVGRACNFQLPVGGTFNVTNHLGAVILRVDEAGAYHIKTGAAWVADLP